MKKDEVTDEKEVRDKIFQNILKFIREEATYFELNEIARTAYHLKMEKERGIQAKHS